MNPKSPFDPAHTGAFLISFYNNLFFFFRIILSGFKYAISLTGFVMILWMVTPICAILDNLFTLTFSARLFMDSGLVGYFAQTHLLSKPAGRCIICCCC